MQAIHVFSRVDAFQEATLAQMRRHWELKQDAVDAFVCVQLAKNPQDTLLSNISRQVFATKSHSRLLARFPLSTNVKERVWSITDDYGREPGWKVSRWIQSYVQCFGLFPLSNVPRGDDHQ